jgi:hypothetical protein
MAERSWSLRVQGPANGLLSKLAGTGIGFRHQSLSNPHTTSKDSDTQ